MMSFLTYITDFLWTLNFCLFWPIFIRTLKSSLKLLSQSQPNFVEMIFGWSPFKKRRRPVSKLAAMTKNRNFFKWPKLLYFKPESPKFEMYKHNDETTEPI